MNQKIKRQWVEALRSGEYKQGEMMLHDRDADTYCCLGVLCALAAKDGVAFAWQTGNYLELLPEAVQVWAGMEPGEEVTEEGDVYVTMRDDYSTLSELNDNGVSFDDIATVIENEL